MSFKELGLSPPVLKAIEECGYDKPTPIQAEAIPQILMMRDIVGLAQTGTGKTGGFTLPMIEILADGQAKARMPRSLVLAPTRELAAQVAENFDTYGKYCKLSKALLTGGVSMDEQIKLLDRGVDVLIATPGRMLDLFERGKILLTDIKILVIDEADRMMDMGFIPDIEKIVSLLPPMRQTLLFSATMPPEIKKLADKFLSNPREIAVARKSSTAENVKQFLVWVHPRKKNELLDQIIQDEDVRNAFIFCNRKRDIGDLTRWLQNHNYAAKEMHGDLSQALRTRTLEEFKDGEVSLLVCSDVAARGIDVDDVSHVFNYDVPMNAEDYVHRIGRTGRAGNEGRAWTLATHKEDKNVNDIERLIKQSIEVPEVAGAGKPPSGSNKGKGSKGSKEKEKSANKPKPGNQRGPRKEKKENPQKAKRNAAAESKKNNKTHKNQKRENQSPGDDVQGFGDDIPSFFQ